MNWHAAMVHVPIGLALVWPWVDLAGFFTQTSAVGWTAVALLGVAVVSSMAATATGQAEYDAAVQAGESLEVLDSHASLAQVVPWALLGLLALRLWGPTRWGPTGQVVGAVVGVLASGLVLYVAHSGGQLVYVHGVGAP